MYNSLSLKTERKKDSLLIGDRIPFGFELDAISTDHDVWKLSGEILIEKNEIEIQDIPVVLKLK